MNDSATTKFNLMRQISGALLSPEYGTYFGAIKRRCWNCASNLVFSMTKKRVRFRDSKTALEINFCFIFFCFRCFLLKKLRLRMCERQILRMHMTNENTMTKNIQLPEFKICNGNKLYFFLIANISNTKFASYDGCYSNCPSREFQMYFWCRSGASKTVPYFGTIRV